MHGGDETEESGRRAARGLMKRGSFGNDDTEESPFFYLCFLMIMKAAGS